jgi:hypothetical protein
MADGHPFTGLGEVGLDEHDQCLPGQQHIHLSVKLRPYHVSLEVWRM